MTASCQIQDDIPEHIRIFLDPSEEEASFKARWGSCRFEKNQNRKVCNNAFDHDAESDYVAEDLSTTQEVFMNMLRLAFPMTATPEDIQAIRKRAMIVLFDPYLTSTV